MAAHPSAPADAPPQGWREPRWGMGDAVAAWVLAQLSAVLLGTLVVVACGYTLTQVADGEVPLYVVALQYPTLWVGFVGVPVWAARTKGNGVVRDFGLRIKPLDIPIGLAIGVVTQLVVVPLVSWPVVTLFDIDPDKLGEPARQLGERATSPSGVILLFLMAAVGAPIAEELLFRGLLLRSIEKRFNLVAAVIGSSVIFGATHFQPLQFPALVAAGLVFALLAVRTGRLGPAITAHMGFNAITVAAVVWS